MRIFIFDRSYMTGAGNLVWEYSTNGNEKYISNEDHGRAFILLNSGVIYKD